MIFRFHRFLSIILDNSIFSWYFFGKRFIKRRSFRIGQSTALPYGKSAAIGAHFRFFIFSCPIAGLMRRLSNELHGGAGYSVGRH
jgi:hypothetical protein